jgi:O-antigen/teichoic acid export membrane protein
MAEFANVKIPHIIFGKYFSGAFLGYFTMVASLANMFAQEVSASFDKANLSSLSRQLSKVDDRQEKLAILSDNAGKMFRIKDIIIIPFYMICFFYSELVIGSLLGAQWLPTAVIFSVLCIRAIFLSYRLSIITILTSLRFTKASFYVSFLSMCIHLLSAVAAVSENDPMLLVYGSVLSNFLTLALSLFLFRLHTGMMLWSATIGSSAVSITLAFVGLLFVYILGTEFYSLVCFLVFILIFVYVLKIKFNYEEVNEFIELIFGAYKKMVSNVR